MSTFLVCVWAGNHVPGRTGSQRSACSSVAEGIADGAADGPHGASSWTGKRGSVIRVGRAGGGR